MLSGMCSALPGARVVAEVVVNPACVSADRRGSGGGWGLSGGLEALCTSRRRLRGRAAGGSYVAFPKTSWLTSAGEPGVYTARF